MSVILMVKLLAARGDKIDDNYLSLFTPLYKHIKSVIVFELRRTATHYGISYLIPGRITLRDT